MIGPLGLIEFFVEVGGELDDDFDNAWLDDHDRIKKVSDYVSTVKQRLIALQEFAHANQMEMDLCEQRLKLLNKQYVPCKVIPIWNRMFILAACQRAYRVALFWFYTGMRLSSFETILPASFEPVDQIMPGSLYRTVTCYKSKYCPDPNRAESRFIPINIANQAAFDFPVTRQFVNAYILQPMGISSHSFRRGLAIAIRIMLEEMGFASKAKIMLVLKAVNKICGWSMSSLEFFDYTIDYKCHTNLEFPDITLYMNYIRDYYLSYNDKPHWLK